MAITEAEKAALLKIARQAVEARARKEKPENTTPTEPGLNLDSGAFVTLNKDNMLRGCIGTFSSPEPLYKTVRDMAAAAASKDPRFVPVRVDELGSIDIEISVLSPLQEIKDVNEIQVGKHGLYIVKGRNRGVLLPQVAIEHSFDRQTFLEHTCLKAGVAPDAWESDDVHIFIFEAEILKEKEGV